MVDLQKAFRDIYASNMEPEARASALVDLIPQFDAAREEDRYTLITFLLHAGIDPRKAEEMGFATMVRGPVRPDIKGPKISPERPVISEGQAVRALSHLKETLPATRKFWVEGVGFELL